VRFSDSADDGKEEYSQQLISDNEEHDTYLGNSNDTASPHKHLGEAEKNRRR
jgi:hypothetical protein